MIRVILLSSLVIIELTIMALQLGWAQAAEAAEVAQETASSLLEEGVLGITTVIFLFTSAALGYAIYKLIKEQKKDTKELTLEFTGVVKQNNDIIMEHAKNEATQSELMREMSGTNKEVAAAITAIQIDLAKKK